MPPKKSKAEEEELLREAEREAKRAAKAGVTPDQPEGPPQPRQPRMQARAMVDENANPPGFTPDMTKPPLQEKFWVAKERATTALRADPQNKGLWLQRAVCHWDCGLNGAAYSDIERAVMLADGAIPAIPDLAIIYADAGCIAKAVQILEGCRQGGVITQENFALRMQDIMKLRAEAQITNSMLGGPDGQFLTARAPVMLYRGGNPRDGDRLITPRHAKAVSVQLGPSDEDPNLKCGFTDLQRQMGLFAKRAFKAGDVVLEEQPFITAVGEEEQSHCHYCGGKLGEEVFESAGMKFRTEECREKATNAFHAALSGSDIQRLAKAGAKPGTPLTALYPLMLFKICGMAMHQQQVAHLMKRENLALAKIEDARPFAHYRRLTDVNSAEGHMRWANITTVVQATQSVLQQVLDVAKTDEKTISLVSNPVLDYMSAQWVCDMLSCNAMALGDDTDFRGLGLLKTGALFNHSNNSNVSWKFNEDTGNFVFTATADIAADAELLIDYAGGKEGAARGAALGQYGIQEE